MKRWYAVAARHRHEATARFNLERQGFAAYLPRYRKRRIHARKVDWIDAPFFPGYLFVSLDLDRDVWRPVLSTVGVRSIVSNMGLPVPVPEMVISEIRDREDEEGYVKVNHTSGLRRGDRVEISAGPLAGTFGLFDSLRDSEKVIVLLNLMGRLAKVCTPLESISATA